MMLGVEVRSLRDRTSTPFYFPRSPIGSGGRG